MMSQNLLAILSVGLIVLASAAQDKPLPPRQAPNHMTMPPGFRATLFAGEPDLVQPIAFAIDDRGRLWVAECYSYPNWQKDGTREGKDRILIFEDRDGDGRFDTRKVFYDKIANISGLQIGFGGVWVCASPNLLFIPDRDGNDVPDGPPQVVLDGWDILKAQHNVFNSLTWGPDGWLYGCNGIQSNSRVGRPGAPDDQRVALNCGVWRYHPTRQIFELVATGTTNPWGLDFDDYGQMFITNCVIHHLWHVIPGAHFQRMYGQDFNPHWYSLMGSCADHIHWAGGPWQNARGGPAHSESGGGHAHSGAMVYLGDNWPDPYRNSVFMCNIHGNRVNRDVLERRGSGYVAHHARDFLLANDPWFRGLALQCGPDGGVFIADWTDTGECHNHLQVDRSNGRIYKVTFGDAKGVPVDLAKLGDAELVDRQLHKNDWHVRHARRLLQERAASGKLSGATYDNLRKMLHDSPEVTRKLRALWALYVTGGLDEAQFLSLLSNPHEEVRAWAVRLALETGPASSTLLRKFEAMARNDPSPHVRLYLAAGLQRIRIGERLPIAEGLVQHAEDAADLNIPLMIWYGIEPLVQSERRQALDLIPRAGLPLIREYLARRIAPLPGGLQQLVGVLAKVNEAAVQRDLLCGIYEAFRGLRTVEMPPGWPALRLHLDSAEVREKSLLLSVLFGDEKALVTLRDLVIDARTDPALRSRALETLLQRKDPHLPRMLEGLLLDHAMRGPALRGLAAFDLAEAPKIIQTHYASLTSEQKSDALHTLAARPAYALALLDAIEAGRIPRQDLSAFTARQLLQFKNPLIDAKLAKVWGTIRPASQEKTTLMARYKAMLTKDFMQGANRSRGRSIYVRTCAACHRLFDDGGDVGPELTGSQRTNLDYLLENLLDPSALVAQDYQVTVVETKDGRLLTGIIKREDERSITVRTQNESIIIPKTEIASRNRSPVSLMPEGLLANLKDEEVRDLIAYLTSPAQVPLPKGMPASANGPARK